MNNAPEAFRGPLLDWYDRHGRELPWRARAGQRADPYHVWLSEIMLQQTTVTAVMPYYKKFLDMWPDVHALADAPAPEIMNAWAGLGYYARARNLHACAKMVSGELKGVFPQEQDDLKKLPGVGDYTSAAIRAIAFNKPATVMDGNIERVMARYFGVRQPLPDSKPALKLLAAGVFENFDQRPGDLAQAMMDLGATICIPGKPRCSLCPLQDKCAAYQMGMQDNLPARAAKKAKLQRAGHVYWVTDKKGRVLIQQRPPKGLLGGMPGFPTSEWKDRAEENFVPPIPLQKIENFNGKDLHVRHVFTHFDLRLDLKRAKIKSSRLPEDYRWISVKELETVGFPSLFKKTFKLYREKDIIK